MKATIDISEYGIVCPENRRELANVLRNAAHAWRPVKKLPTDKWCENNLRIPPEQSPTPGQMDLATRPSMREPLRMVDHPEVETISYMGDAQKGKTVMIMAMLLSRTALDPAPCMIAGPDQDAMRELRDKTYGIADYSPVVESRVPPKRLRNDRYIDLENMHCYLAFSGSAQRFRARSCKNVFCTEVDVWQDNPRIGNSARVIRARTKAWIEHKIVYESTPTDDASVINKSFRAGDQRRFKAPCPHCGRYQDFDFFPVTKGKYAGRGGMKGLRNENGVFLNADEVRSSAYYECIFCCGKIENHHRATMLAKGVWCPLGCKVNKRGQLIGKPKKSIRHLSYHDSAFTQVDKTFGDIAAEYIELEAAGDLRIFYNNWLGLPYTVKGKLPKWKTLARRLGHTHLMGQVPSDVWFLTATADLQRDRLYWTVYGFGDGKTRTLIDCGSVKRDTVENEFTAEVARLGIRSDLHWLRKNISERSFPVVNGLNPIGLSELKPRLTAPDAGNNMREVHNFVRWMGKNVARAIRGDHHVDPQMLFRMTKVEKDSEGKVYEDGCELWGIATTPYKEELLICYTRDKNTLGSLRLPADIRKHPEGIDYLKQIVNEAPVVETKDGKRPEEVWRVINPAVGNHQFDNTVYAMAVADMIIGNRGWDARNWQTTQSVPLPTQKDISPR